MAALAASAATALVSAMVGDAWAQTKTRVAALLGRGGAQEPEVVEGELEESRGELTAAAADGDRAVAADVEAVWRMRLRRLAQRDPEAVALLRRLLDEAGPEGGGGGVRNEMSGTVHGVLLQGRDFTGPVTLGPVPPPGRGPDPL